MAILVKTKDVFFVRIFNKLKSMQPSFKPTKNLHDDLKYLIRFAQCFGMFPLSDTLNVKYSAVTFKWTSLWTFYAIFILFATFILALMNFIRMCANDFKLHLLDSFVFCFNTFFTLLAFFKLSMDWPKLLRNFCRTEAMLRNYNYQRNCRLIFTIIVTISAVAIALEHSLAVAHTYLSINLEMNKTHLEQYFCDEYPFIFDYFPYSVVLGWIVFYVNWCTVFSWGYIDSFIIVMSYALAYRFKQIHKHLKMGINKKYESTFFWGKVREDYTRVAVLCQKVNKRLANIIIISFGANMFSIVSQLYKGLVARRTRVDQFYFLYSFGLLLFRTIFVILYGSMVHTESKKPLSYLVSMRNEAFNLETRRFVLQVYTYDTSLSGGQYFVVTRELLFQMAAVIITYELFLIQAGINIYL